MSLMNLFCLVIIVVYSKKSLDNFKDIKREIYK